MDDDFSDGSDGGDDYDDVGAGWDSDDAPSAAASAVMPLITQGFGAPAATALAGLADAILDAAAAPPPAPVAAPAAVSTIAPTTPGAGASMKSSLAPRNPAVDAVAPATDRPPAGGGAAPSNLGLLLGDDGDGSTSDSSRQGRWDGDGGLWGTGVGGDAAAPLGGGLIVRASDSDSAPPPLDLRFPSGLPGATAAYLFAFDEPSPDQRALALQSGAPASVVLLPKKATGPTGKSGLGPTRSVDEAADGLGAVRLDGRGRPAAGTLREVGKRGARRGAPPLTTAGKGVRQRTKKVDLAAAAAAAGRQPCVVVFVGAAGGGKSTLVGALLMALGAAAPKVPPGPRKGGGGGERGAAPPAGASSKKKPKRGGKKGAAAAAAADAPSPAWLVDEEPVERKHGCSVDIGLRYLCTPGTGQPVALLDAPGGADFGSTAAVAVAQATAAVLVIDGRDGCTEDVLDGVPGSTAEHAALLRSAGVSDLVVVVTHLDAVSASAGRFEQVVSVVRPLLARVGFGGRPSPALGDAMDADTIPPAASSSVTYVPVSALTGANVAAAPAPDSTLAWHNGPTVLAAIERLTAVADGDGDAAATSGAATAVAARPTRLLVYDVTRRAGIAGVTARVRVVAGSVAVGDSLLAAPSNQVLTVKAVEDGRGGRVKAALAGRSGLAVVGLTGGEAGLGLSSAYVLVDPAAPPPVATRFEATLLVTASPVPLLPGVRAVMQLGSAVVAVVVARFGPRRGAATNLAPATAAVAAAADAAPVSPARPPPRPRMLVAGQSATVVIHTTTPVVLEPVDTLKALSRFSLRIGNHLAAAGVVLRVLPPKRLRSELAAGTWRVVMDGEGAAPADGDDTGAEAMATE